MPHYDQKKCFDLFDRVEGELKKEIHVPWLFTLLYVVFSCVFGLFPLWCPGLDCIYSCSLPPFLLYSPQNCI